MIDKTPPIKQTSPPQTDLFSDEQIIKVIRKYIPVVLLAVTLTF